jgi:squalene/oxidosqualene cyclase-like protein
LQQTLQRGFDYLASLQRPEGCVVGEVVWCPIITAQYVLVVYMTGMTGQAISPQRQARFLQHFRDWQTADGGWGLHAESSPYLFVTTLVYLALRLLGVPPDDPLCLRAREWLQAHGGVEAIPSCGKLWLAMMNLYRYEGINPVLPELWLLPYRVPVHPGRLYCHTRLIYLGFCYLYGVRFQVPVTSLIEELRRELFGRPYDSINFAAYRNMVAPTDLYVPPNRVLRAVFGVAQTYERWHPAGMRRRALARVLAQIVAHQRQSNFAAISPVNGLLNILVLYHARHPDFAASLKGADYWTWEDETGGERLNGAQSHTWDTAFAVQAICDGPAPGRDLTADHHVTFLRGAARYFQQGQIRDEVPHRRGVYRDSCQGGFCFGEAHHRWPVSDCTGEALTAICHLYDRVPSGERIELPMIIQAVRFILTRQNPDGGWASYERWRGPLVLERLNTAEIFGNCMIEHSYVECTASCMQGLSSTLYNFTIEATHQARTLVPTPATFYTSPFVRDVQIGVD